jgi:hypothetical protein
MKPLDPTLELLEVKTALLGLIGTSGFQRINHLQVTYRSLAFIRNKRTKSCWLLCPYRKGACFIAGGFYAPLADDLKKK